MSQTLTLYQVEDELAALADTAAIVPEERLAEFAADLARATEHGLAKRDRCIRAFQHVRDQIAFSKAERKRLAEREAALEAGLARFEGYLLGVIAQHGKQTSPTIKRLEGRIGDLCAVDGPGSVEIRNEAEIPLEYRHVVVRMPAEAWDELIGLIGVEDWPDVDVTYSTSASEIKAAIKAGKEVPGATLVFKTGLQIK